MKTPLGFIELESGLMEVYAMNDLFLNFTFEKEENWETFRLIINILLEEYRRQNQPTIVTPIDGKIHIETQYKFYVNASNKNKTRNQDFRIDEIDSDRISYIEFQNKAMTRPPIEVRAAEYFGLGIGQNPEKKNANQIWLLASDADTVLQEKTFAHYILKDETTNNIYPGTSGIMFISLTKLSKEDNLAGELALLLLGRLSSPQNEDVKHIADAFSTSFETFKDDKEVKSTMTIIEKWLMQGWEDGHEAGHEVGREEGLAEGLAEGLTEGANRIVELIKSGLSPDEALRKINEEYTPA